MIAFVRQVSPQLGKFDFGQSPERGLDVVRAKEEHEAYTGILTEAGASLEFLPPLPEHPCGVFVGDTGVLLPEIAIIGRPAVASRLSEIESVTRIVGQYRPAQSIVAPGTLDAADVLRIGHTIYAAESGVTNAEGIGQLREIVQPHGYEVCTVTMRDCPRLRAGCTFIPPHFIAVNPSWIETAPFRTFILVPVSEQEPFAAETLTLGRTTLVSASAPKTQRRLKVAGISTRAVDVSEFEKAMMGLTRLSLILEPRAPKSAPKDGSVTPVSSTGVPSRGTHSAQAVVHGGLVYTSPQPPFAREVAPSRRMPIDEQAEQAIRNLSLVLTAAGSSLDRALRVTIHLADPKHASRVEAVFARVMGRHHPACSIIANGVMDAGILVQVEAVAALTDESP